MYECIADALPATVVEALYIIEHVGAVDIACMTRESSRVQRPRPADLVHIASS